VIGDHGIINSDLGWFNGQTISRLAMVAADEGDIFRSAWTTAIYSISWRQPGRWWKWTKPNSPTNYK